MIDVLLAVALAFPLEAPVDEITPPVATDDSPLFNVIGFCPSTVDSSGWVIVWRPTAPGVDPQLADRLFKTLQGRDVDACLAAIIKADPEAAALVRALGGEGVDYAPIYRAILAAWKGAGVGEALEEVARLGRRGPAVERFLRGCGGEKRSVD